MKPLIAPNRPSFRPDSCVPPADGGDQVDVALAHDVAVFGEGHAPGRALAFGEVLGLAAVGVVLAFEQRDHRVGGAASASGSRAGRPCRASLLLVFAGLLDRQRDRHAGHQHRLAAQQVHQLVLAAARRCRSTSASGQTRTRGAVLAVAGGSALRSLQRLDHVAAGRTPCVATWPSRHTVTSSRLASALVTLTPTPCRPPEKL